MVRQLRLRDIGGIIVIDFIDMANPKNRASVEDALRQELERDRTKTYVVEISPLGLVEMTRQNVTDGPREILTRKCPTCAGDGIVVSDHTVAMQIERKLRALAAPGNRVQAYKVALHPRVLELLVGSGGSRLAAIEEATRRRFFLVPAEGHIHADHFEVVAEGKLVDLQPSSPLVEGSTVELKLGEVGRYDARAAAGKIEGVDVIVADAAKLVGKKATVTIGRVLEGQAFATIVAAGDAGEGPITFESEAEKPTRAPAKRKPTAAPDGEDGDETVVAETDDEPVVDESVDPYADDVADDVEADEDSAEIEAGEPGADGVTPAKKRTRRGSRGGRRRRKPAGAGVAADGAVEDGAAQAGADDETTDVDAVAEPAAADETEAAANGAVTDESKAPQAKAPGRRRTTRIHVPGDPDAPAVAPEVLQEVIAEAQVEAVGAPTETHDDEPEPMTTPLRGRCQRSRCRHRRRRRPGRRQAQDAPRQPWWQEPAQEAGRSRGRARRGRGRDRGRRRGGGCRRRDRERRGRDRRGRGRHRDRARAGHGGRDGAGRRADPEEDEPSAAESEDPGYVPMSEWLDDFDRR